MQIKRNFLWNNVEMMSLTLSLKYKQTLKARSHWASLNNLEWQRQRLRHIWPIGVSTHFWKTLFLIKKSKQFNQSDIARDIPALTLALSVNDPLQSHWFGIYIE